jgi:hypothetical protein
LSAEIFNSDFFLIFFFIFPVGYWAGLRFADITSPDGAQSIVKLIALDVHGDEKPSFLMTTLFELVFSLLVGPFIILTAIIYGGIIMGAIVLALEVAPFSSWIIELIDENFLMAYKILFLAITISYLGRIARKTCHSRGK